MRVANNKVGDKEEKIIIPIFLKDIMPITEISKYKIHFAKSNGIVEPIDEFYKSENDDMSGWNATSTVDGKNNFNCEKILFFARCYKDSKETWLFCGVYDVLGFDNNAKKHNTKLSDDYKNLIGRLKVYCETARQVRVLGSTYFDKIKVVEILDKRDEGLAFPGFENIDINFSDLEYIIKKGSVDWKAALENKKGVYLITNKENGLNYVGAAYGEFGIWSRWSTYMDNLHGNNKKLKELIAEKDGKWGFDNLKMTLLEDAPKKASDDFVMKREEFWKNVLLSRKFGYNAN